MRQFIKNTLISTCNAFGLTLMKNTQHAALMHERAALLAQLTANAPQRTFDDPKNKTAHTCEGIIFSKDRPVQLHALLVSYFELAENPAPLHVSYFASSDAFKQAYRDVAEMFAKHPVTFTPETLFKDDLVSLLEAIRTPNMFFLVDDIIFIRPVDMKAFGAIDTAKYLPSLRLAPHLTYCYTTAMTQKTPAFKKAKLVPGTPEGLLSWNWGEEGNEWSYPLSVDGHLFHTCEITAMTKALQFKAPNSYEGALMRFYDVVKPRLGLCYEQTRIVNIPANKVQTENDNIAGEVTPEDLLKHWETGECIDPTPLYNTLNTAPHQELPFTFKQRSTPPKAKKAA